MADNDALAWRYLHGRPDLAEERPMPMDVGLVNCTDRGTREFRAAVQRANSLRDLAEQAGGRVRKLL